MFATKIHPVNKFALQRRKGGIKDTVRVMVGNIENVLGNLQGVVGDLRVLVHQIDCVTNSLDEQYGTRWRGQADDNVVSTPNNNQESLESCEPQEFSPDYDWSFLGIHGFENVYSWNQTRSYLMPHNIFPNNVEYRDMNTNADDVTEDVSEISSMSTDDSISLDVGTQFDARKKECSASSFDSGNSSSHKDDELFHYRSDSPTVDLFHTCCSGVIDPDSDDTYCGIYEAVMEARLERVHPTFDSFDSDSEDEQELSSAIGYMATYDRDVNTWTSFSMVNIDASQDSDDVESETSSDILNDNILNSTKAHYNQAVSYRDQRVLAF